MAPFIMRALAAAFLIVFVSAQPSAAGPCSKEIDQTQGLIDAKLNQIAASGPSAPQSPGAQLHRQPTPRSIAQSEEKLGQLSPETITKINDAMTQARKADQAGDKNACEQALGEVRKIVTATPK